jgi:hypothetical protein
MKFSVGITIAAMMLVLGLSTVAAGAKRPADNDGMYSGLRDMTLHMKPEDLGLNPADREPYAVVMDMDMNGYTATITSFATGDASLYLSTGGGTIGAGQASEDVSRAAKKFVRTAATHLDAMTKADSQPLPQSGEVIFYVMTRDGIYSASRSQRTLGEGRDDLSPLFYSGQEVLTQIRLLQESQTGRSR